MRFTCEKNMLVTGLNIAGRTVAQKSSLSVIEGILCKAGQGLSLTGYNMETAITYEIDADVSDMGQCILPAKLFGDIIRRLPEGPVTVVVDENYKVSIRAGYASFTISAESAEDYPELPDVGDGREIYIPQNKLKELISGTIFAVSENQGRPIHTGVKFEVTNDAITAVAVDGFRLARRTFHPEEGTGRELNFVVPAAGLKEVEKILTDVEDNAAFTLGTKHILFQVGNATLVCRLLEGEFLDWRRVVPSNCPIKMVANVGDLASSVERVGLIVSEKYKSPVRCVFGNQELLMRTSTTIGAAEDRCSLAGDGQELEIGFNVRYLAEALRVIPSEEVTLELTNGLSPIVLTPVDEKEDLPIWCCRSGSRTAERRSRLMKVVVKKKDNAIPVAITTEYIKLQDAMKLANAAETGGEAKLMIQEGQILVNGEICQMRGKKLRPGDRFVCDGQAYQIITHESE